MTKDAESNFKTMTRNFPIDSDVGQWGYCIALCYILV